MITGVARILRQGRPVGAGFLVSPRHVITCAHVVNAALGRDAHHQEAPAQDLALDLHLPLAGGEGGNSGTSGESVGARPTRHWCPPTLKAASRRRTDDMAVLLLERPVAAELVPARNRGSDFPPDTPVFGWGTPASNPNGQWARAVILGAEGSLYQLSFEQRPPIDRGFSGGPLTDQAQERVLGMILQRDAAAGVAWIIPPEAIQQVLFDLRLIEIDLSLAGGVPSVAGEAATDGTDLSRLAGLAVGPESGDESGDESGEETDDDTGADPDADPGRALYRALFQGREIERELLALDHDAQTPDDTAPKRLRLRCADPDAALLPWHCLTRQDGQRLGERGWVIEVTVSPAAPGPATDQAPGQVLGQAPGQAPNHESNPAADPAADPGLRQAANLSLLAPLVLATSDPELAPEVGFHVDQVLAHLAPLTVNPAVSPRWAVGSLDLDEQLRDTPELVYCFARLDNEGGLLLGTGAAAEAIAPADLLRLLARCEPAPMLWLHWVEDDPVIGAMRLRELVSAFFDAAASRLSMPPMLLVQRTTEDDLGTSLNDVTLELLRNLAPAGRPDAEPAALFARLGDPRGLCLLGQGGLALHRPVDSDAWLRASIHAALLRLLLGRSPQKAVIRDRVLDGSAPGLLFYAVCGDRQARVHDFPDQARWHLRDNPELRVRHRSIPCRMRPDDDIDSLRTRLHEALQLNPRKDSTRKVLLRMEHPPVPRETIVISLHWQAEPDDGFQPGHLDAWLGHWKAAMLGVFGAKAIPDQYRILCGLCLQWADPSKDAPQPWPERQGQTDQDIQDRLRDRLERGNPAHCEYLLIERPLGRLRPAELERFFIDEQARLKGYTRGLPAARLADWVHAETQGRFRDSVETIYRACHRHFDRVDQAPDPPATPRTTP